MSVGLEARVVPSDHVLCKDLGDELVLLDLATETYFGLDATASRMWKALTSESSIARAVEALLAEYDIERCDLERDLCRLVDDLLGQGLLRVGHA